MVCAQKQIINAGTQSWNNILIMLKTMYSTLTALYFVYRVTNTSKSINFMVSCITRPVSEAIRNSFIIVHKKHPF